MVRGLACLNDSGTYTGGGLSPWQVKPSRAGLRGETRRNPASGPLGWGLGVRLATPPRKNKPCYGNYNNYTYHKGPYSGLEPDIRQYDHICL